MVVRRLVSHQEPGVPRMECPVSVFCCLRVRFETWGKKLARDSISCGESRIGNNRRGVACQEVTSWGGSSGFIRLDRPVSVQSSGAMWKRYGMTVTVLVPSSLVREAAKREATRKLGTVARAAVVFQVDPHGLPGPRGRAETRRRVRRNRAAVRRDAALPPKGGVGRAGRTRVRWRDAAAPRALTDRLRT